MSDHVDRHGRTQGIAFRELNQRNQHNEGEDTRNENTNSHATVESQQWSVMNSEISKVGIREVAEFHTHTNLFESRISNKQTKTPGAHEPRRATSVHASKKGTEINHRRGGEPELDEHSVCPRFCL